MKDRGDLLKRVRRLFFGSNGGPAGLCKKIYDYAVERPQLSCREVLAYETRNLMRSHN